jgi:ferredoxin-NADP reductase
MDYLVKILGIDKVTHDVNRYRLEKPEGYHFIPGQATEVAIDKPGWRDEKRPFTFTALNEMPYLEFTIKSYPDRGGVTGELARLKPGDSLIIGDVWGAIEYKGPGYFIAGGAGITPFIAILRNLKKTDAVSGNRLFFSNKTAKDIIYEEELIQILGKENLVFVLTKEQHPAYDQRYINEDFFRTEVSDFQKHFYVCGPDPMIQKVNEILVRLGASPELVVFEK